MGTKTVAATRELDTLLGRLPEGGDLAVVRDGEEWVIAIEPTAVMELDGEEAVGALSRLPTGWWAAMLAYDLGRAVERVPEHSRRDLPVPDLLLGRFECRLRWHPVAGARIEGGGAGLEALEAVIRGEAEPAAPAALRGWHSSLDRPGWESAVRRILEHLHAGDCYQVNLTRRLECDAAPDPVALFRALVRHNPAPHAALVRFGDVAVVSASPERFLRRDGQRIETRPIKGTSTDAETLRHSEKDRAENVMIVDLARNDLGRICEYRSVHVPALCELETHPGLHHLVSTVAGTLREAVTPGDVIRATFPPASVTGCPKPRVLEIIETLEPVRRGFYCGAIGFIDTNRDVLDLNVAIRTFTVTRGRTYLGVGAGIVADSDPRAEWQETELKARRLLQVAGGEPAQSSRRKS